MDEFNGNRIDIGKTTSDLLFIVYWDADGFLSIVLWNILYQVIFCEIICFQ